MSDEWLGKIAGLLSSETGFEAADAYQTAVEVDSKLPDKDSTFSESIRRAYEVWVRRKGYMFPPMPVDYHLPESAKRADSQIAAEFQLKTAAGVRDKQMQFADNANARVDRAEEYLGYGWDEGMCVSFVASREEWRMVQRRVSKPTAYSSYQGGGEPDAPW